MSSKYKEYKDLNFARIADEVLEFWRHEQIFEKSVTNREGADTFTFYEGPPSANGTPGIHHVMARTVKDIFCRFKTLQGYQVKRKGGWDTHGLPVELQVEKLLGITKDDIGKKISVAEYNQKCRETVMMYKDQWDDLTRKMGYWVDLDAPYITYQKEYIETLWWLLRKLYDQKLLYKGYSIQPYSPGAGTGLSSHELNLPGCYKDVKDTSIVAQFQVKKDVKSGFLFEKASDVHILAWTTTPWTLPANTALTIGEKINYVQVNTFNSYTHKPVSVVLAKDLFSKYFSEKNKDLKLEDYKPGDKAIPWQVVQDFAGKDMVGIKYHQLMPYTQPFQDADKAFQVISGDFVTTEDGTGVVHTAPTFGADDFRVAKLNDIPPMTLKDDAGNEIPVVDKKGKFITAVGEKLAEGVSRYKIKTHRQLGPDDFYVKNYTDEDESHPDYKTTDVIISIILKEENKAFKVEKYEHTYPHCWRTDKPVLYYPLDSWFIRTTALKDRMVALNKTINWKPESTGTGRFGNWLENLVDWNLSRSRYWGTPLPIWRSKDGKEERCIGSLEELNREIEKSIAKGLMKKSPLDAGDLHRPYVDEVILVSESGEPMFRETDLIDVWFDSGAMPYAQWHYPFENQDVFEKNYPADFIAEGVDQTRGWFFTLHAIATLIGESSEEIQEVNRKNNNPGVAFRNVISNGLVLDKAGNKMSKSKGNVVNPFETLSKYGADLVRWYMIENAPPWDNLKFDFDGIVEVQRRFFGTLLNTYSFYALYANIDGFVKDEMHNVSEQHKTNLDRWILSKLQSLVLEVTSAYDEYEPTRAARAIQEFVNDHLSNWYVRLNRKRFWKPTYAEASVGGPAYASASKDETSGTEASAGRPSYASASKDETSGTEASAGRPAYASASKDETSSTEASAGRPAYASASKDETSGTEASAGRPACASASKDETSGTEALAGRPACASASKDETSGTEASAGRPAYASASKDETSGTEASAGRPSYASASKDETSSKEALAGRPAYAEGSAKTGVRLNEDKQAAYETLFECMMVTAQLMAPIAPFFSEWLYKNLTDNIRDRAVANNTPLRHVSVHLTDLTHAEEDRLDRDLETSMDYAQRICSLVHSIRKNSKIKVRTPLQRILLPVIDKTFAGKVRSVEAIILAEVNVKAIEYIDDTSGLLVKKVKPNFAKLGKQYGAKMKEVSAVINGFDQSDITAIEKNGRLSKGGFDLTVDDVLISSEDIPGWSVASENGLTVALDVQVTEELKREGLARDFVNRVQNLRKDLGLAVLDKINIEVERNGEALASALTSHKEYISTETQALSLELKDKVSGAAEVDMDDFMLKIKISVNK